MTDTTSKVRKHHSALGLSDRMQSALATITVEAQTHTVAWLAPLDQFHTRGKCDYCAKICRTQIIETKGGRYLRG